MRPIIAVRSDTTAVASDRYCTDNDESLPFGSIPGGEAFHSSAKKTPNDASDTIRSVSGSFFDITCVQFGSVNVR